jgi:hypothetical protein
MNDMALGEKRMSSVCWAKNAMCAWTDSLASARISKQCWVCSSVLVEGVLALGIQRRGGLGARTGGVRTLDGPAALSAEWGRHAEVGGATSTRDLRGDVMGISVDGWLCCVVLCCVVSGCAVLCCVVLCCVVLGCVGLCWVVLGCVGLCWVVLWCVVLVVLCFVALCCVVLCC